MSRARDAHGKWGLWYLVANRPYPAEKAVAEYGRRPGCEAGFRDAKWWLGFAQARIKQITAWARLFALFAIALLVVVSLATRLLLRRDQQAEDAAAHCQLFRYLFEYAGHAVAAVATGAAALAQLGQRTPDLMVCDLQLVGRDLDGYAITPGAADNRISRPCRSCASRPASISMMPRRPAPVALPR
jgi:hypothetical protein